MSEVATLAVFGSCISRDNFNSRFNPEWRRWYAIGPTANQSTMIALMAPPVEAAWAPIGDMTDYDRWNVGADLTRSPLTELAEAQPDYLVLDFFGDVHFGTLTLPDGGVVTDNRWKLHRTDLYAALTPEQRAETLRWQDDEEAYVAAWTAALDRFVAYLAEHTPQTRVIVHHGFDVEQVAPAEGFPNARDGQKAIQRANAMWRRLNTLAAERPGWRAIDLRDEWYPTAEDHPWGPSPVHYQLDYYPRFLAELHRLVLGDVHPELRDDLDAIAAAAHERVVAEVEHWRGLLRWLRDDKPRLGRRNPLQRRRLTTALERPDTAAGRDHELAERLLPLLDGDARERVAAIGRSADDHIAWIRDRWLPRIERSAARG